MATKVLSGSLLPRVAARVYRGHLCSSPSLQSQASHSLASAPALHHASKRKPHGRIDAEPSQYHLSDKQIKFFRANSFLVLDDLLSEDYTRRVQKWTEELQALPETPGKWMKYFERSQKESGRQLCRIENFMQYHEGYHSLINDPRILSILKTLGGQDMILFKEKINFKLPGGAGFRPHQDAPAYAMLPQSYHITTMVLIDEALPSNGCLRIVYDFPDSMRSFLRQNRDGTIADEVMKSLEFHDLTGKAGTIIMFNSFVPHYSEKNESSLSRRVLYATYSFKSEGDNRDSYYAEKRLKFPPEVERLPGRDYGLGSGFNLGNPIL